MNNPRRPATFPTKETIDKVLFGGNRKLLQILPKAPEDVVDAYAFARIHALAMANMGCGLSAIAAACSLKHLNCLSYAELRNAVRKQKDFNDFVKQHGANFTTND